MTTRVILVCHGEVAWGGREPLTSHPAGCPGLSERGRATAALLRERWTRIDGGTATMPKVVYSSPLPRAIQTARELAEASAAEVSQHCGLCSFHVSERLAGLPGQEVRRRHGDSDDAVYRAINDGVESWAELVNRVGTTLHALTLRHRGGTIVAVTHPESIEASLHIFGNVALHRGFDVRIAPTSVTEWSTEADPRTSPARWTLARLNDTAHLPC